MSVSGHAEERAEQAGEMRVGSEVHLDEWVSPDIADERGFLRAGKILEWMDVVGVLAASRHCRRPVVTASVDGVELCEPVRVGERVSMTAAIAYTSSRSVGVSVSMSPGGGARARPRKAVAGYMTFVAVDEGGRVVPVPPFTPTTPAEVARVREGSLRREFRAQLESGQLSSSAAAASLLEARTPEERNALIREVLKVLPRLGLPWDKNGAPGPRTRQHSYVHRIEPIRSDKLNFHGTLYGGTLMRWVETAATLSAQSYLAGAHVRFTGLQGLTFLKAIEKHRFIHIRSMVVHTTASSLTVLVSVQAEDPLEAHRHDETLRAFLTYVPASAASTRVPPVECVSAEERALFSEVEHRLELQRLLRRADEGE
jgi:acyl-CoA hydrolase